MWEYVRYSWWTHSGRLQIYKAQEYSKTWKKKKSYQEPVTSIGCQVEKNIPDLCPCFLEMHQKKNLSWRGEEQDTKHFAVLVLCRAQLSSLYMGSFHFHRQTCEIGISSDFSDWSSQMSSICLRENHVQRERVRILT